MSAYRRVACDVVVAVQVALFSTVAAANGELGTNPPWCFAGVAKASSGKNADMLIQGATQMERRGDDAAALRSLCAAFELLQAQGKSPRSSQVANYAGTILFRDQGDLDAAIAAFRDAIKYADPVHHASEAATAHANLANAYFRKGLMADSQQELSVAIRFAARIPGAEQRHVTLGTIAIKQGLLADAAETLDLAEKYYKSARLHANAVSTKAPPAIRLSAAQLYAEASHNLAALEISRGNQAGAIRLLMPLRSWAHEHQMPVAEEWITFTLLMAFQGVNQDQQVLALYQDLKALQQNAPDASLMASEDMAVAQSYYRLGQVDDAQSALSRAAQFFGQQHMVSELAQALNFLGVLAMEQGRSDDAEHAFTEALKGRCVINDRVGEGVTLNALADLAWRRNEADKAIALLEQAVAILKQTPEPLFYARALGSLGEVLQAEGQVQQARGSLKEAVEIMWHYRAVRQSPALGANEIDRMRPIYSALIANFLSTGENDMALAVAEQLRAASVRFDVNAQSDTRLRGPAQADTTALTAARDKVFRALQAREKEPSARNEQKASTAIHDLDLAMTRFELAAGEGGGTDIPFPALLAKLQASLGSRALLLYHKGEDGWIVFGISKDTKVVLRLAVSPLELMKKIAAFREFAWDDGSVPPELGWLYQQLIAPVQALVGTHDLIVVPSAELNLLPFAALHDGQAYLGQKRIVTNALGIGQALQMLSERLSGAAGAAVLLSAATPSGAEALLHADEEVDAAAKYLPHASIIKNAGAADYKGRVTDAAIVHLSAHAVADTGRPLLSRILLMHKGSSDGYLSIADIRGQPLRRQPLVVLSGCETSIGTVSTDEAVHNLSSAFLEAGAGAVVSSLWRIDDASTAFFMGEFYRSLASGTAPSQALYQAMRSAMAQYPHPYYWAAFTYIGPP